MNAYRLIDRKFESSVSGRDQYHSGNEYQSLLIVSEGADFLQGSFVTEGTGLVNRVVEIKESRIEESVSYEMKSSGLVRRLGISRDIGPDNNLGNVLCPAHRPASHRAS
jgi:hypothetical protein